MVYRAVLDYSLKRTTDPVIQPVSLAEAKEHIADGDVATDEQINAWIEVATEQAEKDARRSFITQTWTMKMRAFPTHTDHIELRRPPLLTVSSITYLDTDGASQTWASSNYEVDTNRDPGVVWLAYDKTFPATRDIQNAVTVTYTAGYGATRATVPQLARQAIMYQIQWLAQHRSPSVEESRDYTDIIHSLRPGVYR